MNLHKRSLAMLRPLTHFLAVANHRTVSEAAAALQVAPSRVSESLRYLEEVLNVRLFRRERKRMVLTHAGQELLSRYQDKLSALMATVQEDISPHTIKPVLTMTAPVDISLMLLPSAIAAFKQQYPQVEVSMVVSDQRVDLFSTHIDLAFRVGPVADDDNDKLPLFKATAVLVAAPDQADQFEHSIEAGQPVPFVNFSPLPSMESIKLSQPERSVLLQPTVSADNALVCEQLVLQGLGVGLFSELWVRNKIAQRELVEIGTVADADAYVYASWPGPRPNAGARAFLQVIRQATIRQ